jgi:hypothetical protein
MPDSRSPTERLSAALSVLGWSPRQVARHLQINEQTMRRAVRGDLPLPEPVLSWLDDLSEPVSGQQPSRQLIEDRLNGRPLPDGWHEGVLQPSWRDDLTRTLPPAHKPTARGGDSTQ